MILKSATLPYDAYPALAYYQNWNLTYTTPTPHLHITKIEKKYDSKLILFDPTYGLIIIWRFNQIRF